jgi:hypothetical protein
MRILCTPRDTRARAFRAHGVSGDLTNVTPGSLIPTHGRVRHVPEGSDRSILRRSRRGHDVPSCPWRDETPGLRPRASRSMDVAGNFDASIPETPQF